MTGKSDKKKRGLELEVQEVEQFCNPGCGSSSTNPRCTCPIGITTTGSLFTAKSSY